MCFLYHIKAMSAPTRLFHVTVTRYLESLCVEKVPAKAHLGDTVERLVRFFDFNFGIEGYGEKFLLGGLSLLEGAMRSCPSMYLCGLNICSYFFACVHLAYKFIEDDLFEDLEMIKEYNISLAQLRAWERLIFVMLKGALCPFLSPEALETMGREMQFFSTEELTLQDAQHQTWSVGCPDFAPDFARGGGGCFDPSLVH